MEKIWSYLLHLGDNMWEDPLSPKPKHPVEASGGWPYSDILRCDREVWRRVVDQLPSFGINTVLIDIGDAMQYESHPELSVEGAWTREELSAELAHMRSIGLEPLPKLNLSACHDGWLHEYAYMLSTPTYYAVVKDLIAEVCEVFGNPRLFHLGMDEEDYPDHHVGMTSIRSDALWWHDLYFYFDEVEHHGARPWIWSDYFWKHQSDFAKKMPKECVQSNWFYDPILPKNARGNYQQVAYQSYVELSRMGYDQIPCASDWLCRQNMAQTVWLCLEEGLCDEHMLGIMNAPWLSATDLNYYSLLNGAQRTKYARAMFEEYSPETRDEMIARMTPDIPFKF